MVKKVAESFESAITELEQIIQHIEVNQVDLDHALNQYKHGMELVKFCQEKIKILDQETNQLKDFNAE